MKRLLLDTCAFLWLIKGEPTLPERVQALVADPDNEVALSVVSAWEIAVKHGLGKLDLPQAAQPFVQHNRERHGIATLPLEEAALAHLERLPAHHRDPFDRLLICQAIAEGMALLTPDPLIQRYPVRTLW